MTRTRPLAALILLSALTLGLLAGCGGSGAAPAQPQSGTAASQPSAQPTPASTAPIKIGAIFAATGPGSSLGKPERDTVLMLADQINAKGGINGRKIEIVYLDSESDNTKAVLHMKKLAEDKEIVGIVGGTTSGESLAMLKVAEDNQVPFISVAASADIVQPVKKWVFKTPATDQLVVEAIVNQLKAKGLTRVAWLSVNSAFGDGGAKQFEDQAKAAGITIVDNERYGEKDSDMTAQVTRAKAAQPQAVIVWSTPPSAAVVAKNIAQLGLKLPQFQSHGIANQAFIDGAGDAAEGVIFPAQKLAVWDTLAADDPVAPLASQYVKDFQAKYNYFPTTFGAHAYDGFTMFVKALQAVGPDRAKVRDYIEGLKNFVSAGGVFNLGPSDHLGLTSKDIALVTIKGGKWVRYQG